ncbi:MAG: hypothetical protein IAE79_20020, partial [Anaerolinea sp.]|nr:hypothetical protein [Anaerolinea sp.]
WHSSANAYLVVWQRDGNVWARPFTAIGTPLNPAFAVSTASGAAPAPQMTGDHFQYGLASGTFKFI